MLLAAGIDIHAAHQSWHQDILNETRETTWCATRRWIPIVVKHSLRNLDDNAWQRARGRLYCSMTEVPSWRKAHAFKNHLITDFQNNTEMVQAMAASGHVGLLYHPAFTCRFRDMQCVDGSVTWNSPKPFPDLPWLNLQTWLWRAVKPHWYLISTNEEWIEQLYAWGYEDAKEHQEELDAVLSRHEM